MTTDPIISIRDLSKIYKNGHEALKSVDLDIHRGEILALLGPNGAGKTTLISIICGLVSASGGSVTVDGHDTVHAFRKTRELIGLVPQELTVSAFDRVHDTISFSRGLFGKPPNPGYIDKLLADLSLTDKRNAFMMTLSGGMKRRVLIAKALSHEPRILFLDEPTAGVDVELRKDMWQLVEELRRSGVTIILTTHYIEEAEEIADRVGVINNGELLLVEDKTTLMQKLGKKTLVVDLTESINVIPDGLKSFDLSIGNNGRSLIYTYEPNAEQRTGITTLLSSIHDSGLQLVDLHTSQSSLEDIFVDLVSTDDSGSMASSSAVDISAQSNREGAR